MGIPGFFAWLQRKYPAIVRDIQATTVDFSVDLPPITATDEHSPGATGGGNGNGEVGSEAKDMPLPQPHSAPLSTFACRNLFLDTNGIIHSGTHPPGGEIIHDEAQMFANMHAILDRIVALANPKDLLFIAVDGVAPRAKINQQRARRFVAARDRGIVQKAVVETLDQMRQEKAPPALEMDTEMGEESVQAATKGGVAWDHNAISPGTAFMDRMIVALKAFIARRMLEAADELQAAADSRRNANATIVGGWSSKTLKIVFSDCSVPGEGEHKIMDFIRREKHLAATSGASTGAGIDTGSPTGSSDAATPPCTHCIYGEDADLIMLALSLHDPRIRVMRELQVYKRNELIVPKDVESIPYAVVDLGLLRKHLNGDLFRACRENIDVINVDRKATGAVPLEFDLERAIDDFVLLGFMIGNDFVPALPALDIRLGALELLLEIHTETFAESGWLTNGSQLNFDALRAFMTRLASVETALLQQNLRQRKKTRKNNMRWGRGGRGRGRGRGRGKHGYGGGVARQCTKFADGRNCRKGKRCTFLHGDHVPAVRLEKQKSQDMERMLRGYLNDDSPSGEVELDLGDVVLPTSKKAVRGLFALCDKLGLDYNESDVVDSGEVYVCKYDDSVEATERKRARFLNYVNQAAARRHEEATAIAVAALRAKSEASEALVDVSKSKYRQRFYEQKLGLCFEPPPAGSTSTSTSTGAQPGGTGAGAGAGGVEDARETVMKLCGAYIEGLQWVLSYYYSGCASWEWYYPGHYAPFAIDLAAYLCDPAFTAPSFVEGAPLRPFEQLMAILPPASARVLLPAPLAEALQAGSLASVFPSDDSDVAFEVDPNGQDKEYQWLPLLPFLNTDTVREAANRPEIQAALSKAEQKRNSVGASQVLLWGNETETESVGCGCGLSWKNAGFPGALTNGKFVHEDPAFAISISPRPSIKSAERICAGQQLHVATLELPQEKSTGIGVQARGYISPRKKLAKNPSPSANANGVKSAIVDEGGDVGEDLPGGGFGFLDSSDGDGAGDGDGDSDSDFDDGGVFASAFEDAARSQRFAPLGTLDAVMRTIVEEQQEEEVSVLGLQ